MLWYSDDPRSDLGFVEHAACSVLFRVARFGPHPFLGFNVFSFPAIDTHLDA